MNDSKKLKGNLKDYNRWLLDEMEDYVQPVQESHNDSKKVINLISMFEETKWNPNEKGEDESNENNQSKNIKVGKNFDFLKTLEKFRFEALLMYLSCGDIFTLMRVSKASNLAFDTPKTWMSLMARDFRGMKKDLENVYVESPKQLYRYLFYSNSSEILHNNADFLKYATFSTHNIAANIADSIPLSTTMKTLVTCLVKYEVRDDESRRIQLNIINDLNISIVGPNEVSLWVGGWFFDKKPENPRKKQKKITVAQVIKHYKLPKHREVQKASFLSDRILIIETKKTDEPVKNEAEEEKINAEQKEREEFLQAVNVGNNECTLVIIDLHRDLDFGLSHLDCYYPLEVTFYPYRLSESKAEEDLKESLVSKENKESLIGIGMDEVKEVNGFMVAMKMLNDSEIVFVTKETKKPLLTIYNTQTKKLIHQTVVEINSPLYDIVISQKPKADGETRMFLIDQESGVYYLTLSADFQLKITGIFFEAPEVKKAIFQPKLEQQNQPFAVKNEICKCLLGNYAYHTQIQREYLIANRLRTFCFINVENLQKHEFALDGTDQGYMYNWTAYEDKLVVLTSCFIYVYQFSVDEPRVVEIQKTIQRLNSNMGYTILMNSCYTALVNYCSWDRKEYCDFKVIIRSTQSILSEKCEYFTPSPYGFRISGALRGKDVLKLAEKWDLQIKLLDEKFLLKTPFRVFFMDLEIFRKFQGQGKEESKIEKFKKVNMRGYGNKQVKSDLVREPKTDEAPKPEKKMTLVYKNIPENPNVKVKKEKNWKDKAKDQDFKDKREQDHAVRAKGRKYHKTVRQKERLDKQL